jgi:hypothetical protein
MLLRYDFQPLSGLSEIFFSFFALTLRLQSLAIESIVIRETASHFPVPAPVAQMDRAAVS